MKRLVLVAAVVCLSACGGGSTSTTPTQVSAPPSISTTNTMVYIGQVVTFAATGTGTITWGGDQPAVATVDGPTGRVTGVATGDETIWAQSNAGRTTRLIHVLPSFAGTWSGNYAVTGCQSTGDFARGGFCPNFPNGLVLNLGLAINQTQDQVTGGSFALGAFNGTLNPGSVSGNGQLPLTGVSTTSTSSGATVTILLGNARLDSQQAGVMTGTFDATFGQNNLAGTGILSAQIRLMTRTGGGPSAIFQRPEPELTTFAEMIQRLKR